MRERIFVSFSSGRTSAYMAKRLLDERLPGQELLFVMANSSQEDPRALEFADRCDRAWGLDLIYVEADIDPRVRVGTGHRIVSFETADREGGVFQEMVSKYGLPNKSYPHCTRELKLHPLHSYVESIWGPDYFTAIGIRADELDRRSRSAEAKRIIYPLIEWGIRKEDVVEWWKDQPFDLYHPENLGNCTWCWKKSLRKHLTNITQHPEIYEFPKMLEREYSTAGRSSVPGHRVMFRENRTVADIEYLATQPFEPFVDGNEAFDPVLDATGGACGTESCEIWADDDDPTILAMLSDDARIAQWSWALAA